ncbi:MAG: hypothetical protein Q9169_003926 [Polycauliona sp. 2 TL-2023]
MKASSSDSEFADPIANGGTASFDVHIYFHGDSDHEVKAMRSLRQAIQVQYPEVVLYSIHDQAIGPHPLPMFEVDLFTPAQFGAFIPWLAIHHGPLSVLVHPNTGKSRLDHTHHAIWIGKKLDLTLDVFDKEEEMDEVAKKLKAVSAEETDEVEDDEMREF